MIKKLTFNLLEACVLFFLINQKFIFIEHVVNNRTILNKRND